MIDKKYYQANLLIYYSDFLGSLILALVAFGVCLQVEWPLLILPYLLCCLLLYRAGAFMHELTHQSRNPRLRAFYHLWNLTAGALTLVPAVRFIGPHVTHHQSGIFRTQADPQYPLLREDLPRALFILLVIPCIMPLYNFVLVVTSSFGYLRVEQAIDEFLTAKGNPTGSEIASESLAEVIWLGRYTLVLWSLLAWFLPEAIPLAYAVHVGAWALTTWRIPLEHELRHLKTSSDESDQMEDSYTIEAPLAALLQPLGLRFHTAHHMYPGVPYHNLRALHEELKRSRPGYREKILPFWTAVFHGPGSTAISDRRIQDS